MLRKTVEISILYDFYKQLLTEKQKNIVDLYYNQDLSLGEIAQGLDVSRQAVYDMLKRTERLLYDYEEKLNFIKITDDKNNKISKILDDLSSLEDEIKSVSSKQSIKHLTKIKNQLYKLLNN